MRSKYDPCGGVIKYQNNLQFLFANLYGENWNIHTEMGLKRGVSRWKDYKVAQAKCIWHWSTKQRLCIQRLRLRGWELLWQLAWCMFPKMAYPGWKCQKFLGTPQSMSWQTSSVKGQIVHVLGFTGQCQLWLFKFSCHSRKAAKDDL